jgi:hypothetical protein
MPSETCGGDASNVLAMMSDVSDSNLRVQRDSTTYEEEGSFAQLEHSMLLESTAKALIDLEAQPRSTPMSSSLYRMPRIGPSL